MRSNTPNRSQKTPVHAKPVPAFNSMATPRRAQQRQKPGILGFMFVLGLLGGFVWISMLIFGWGPYANESFENSPEVQTPISIVSLASLVPSTTTIAPTEAPTSAVIESETEVETTIPTEIGTVTSAPTQALLPFILSGEPEPMSSALIRPGLGCDYLVIAGQVWDLQDAPVKNMKLHLTGELAGYSIDHFAETGSAIDYGKSGYEFALKGLLVDSQNSLFIQLVDRDDNPLSNPYALETFEDCQKNLIMVNFKQVR